MKLKKIYEIIVDSGVKADPRGKKIIQKSLDRKKEIHRELKKNEKEFFDIESITNPYADTRILYGTVRKR